MGFLFRLLLLIGLAAIVWRLVRNALAPPPPTGAASATGDAQGFEATGRCAKCGTHVPRVQLDAAGVCQRCRN